jgi:hypothetical protein
MKVHLLFSLRSASQPAEHDFRLVLESHRLVRLNTLPVV